MSTLPAIERFESNTGLRIYRIPMIVFPNGFMAYSYVVLGGEFPFLVDTGSGWGDSNAHLMAGINSLKSDFGESLTVQDIDYILITHGHIDHFGGVAFIAEQTGAKIGIHELDRRVLTNYEERLIMATKDLSIYLERAGVPQNQCHEMINMYNFAKTHVKSVRVDFDLQEDAIYFNGQIIHTPGHCPGQVCIKLGDVLLSADHVLSHTTPHQAPERITAYTGLGHYQDSLRKIAKVEGISLALGGHEAPIYDFYERVEAIMASHNRKLNVVRDIIKNAKSPCTIYEITQIMYPNKTGYETLLALEEAGAHIEYLYEHGQISVDNLDEVEKEYNPALKYTLT